MHFKYAKCYDIVNLNYIIALLLLVIIVSIPKVVLVNFCSVSDQPRKFGYFLIKQVKSFLKCEHSLFTGIKILSNTENYPGIFSKTLLDKC